MKRLLSAAAATGALIGLGACSGGQPATIAGTPVPSPTASAPTSPSAAAGQSSSTTPPAPTTTSSRQSSRPAPATPPTTKSTPPSYSPPAYTPPSYAPPSVEQPGAPYTLSVTTTGPGISSVTYSKPGFNIAQDTEVSGTAWSVTIEDTYEAYMKPNLNAQNDGGGTISCSIKQGGKVVSENSSKGEYAVVSCG